VVFSVDADIYEPGKAPEHFKATVEGKAAVIEALAARHFNITIKCEPIKLDFQSLKGDRVKVNFICIETKNEPELKDPITYMYTGRYTMPFSEDLKVTRIDLCNRRDVYHPAT